MTPPTNTLTRTPHATHMKKYLICPGYVISKNDGDRHYISANQLLRLYRVNPAECEVLKEADPWEPRSLAEQRERRYAGLIRLAPRYDGDYRLPAA